MNNQQDGVSGCPYRELAIGWALHALDPSEKSLVMRHLAGCSTCARTVAETEEVAAMLALSVPQLIPSVGLEQRILNATAAAPVVPLTRPTQPGRPITEPSEVDFRGWLSITWADVVGPAGVEQALLAVGNSRIG